MRCKYFVIQTIEIPKGRRRFTLRFTAKKRIVTIKPRFYKGVTASQIVGDGFTANFQAAQLFVFATLFFICAILIGKMISLHRKKGTEIKDGASRV